MSVTFDVVRKGNDGVWRQIEDSPELNLGNASARQLIETVFNMESGDLLGLMDPTTVEMKLNAFSWSRWTELTRPSSDNHGISMDANGIRGTCRMIDCGRSIDAVREDLYQLHLLVEFAHETGGMVSWG